MSQVWAGAQFVSDSSQCANQVSARRRTQRNRRTQRKSQESYLSLVYFVSGCDQGERLNVLQASARRSRIIGIRLLGCNQRTIRFINRYPRPLRIFGQVKNGIRGYGQEKLFAINRLFELFAQAYYPSLKQLVSDKLLFFDLFSILRIQNK